MKWSSAAPLLFAIALALPALADDAGAVAADAKILLARTARSLCADPSCLTVWGVTVSGDTADLSWQAGRKGGRVTLTRRGDRWFLDPPRSNASAAGPVHPQGGTLDPPPAQTAGYALTIGYSANDASAQSRFSFIYGRWPTKAEFLPYPTMYPIASNAVFYFDLTIDSPKPLAFARGSTVDVWFPFVLDDKLRYDLFVDGAGRSIGPISSRVFDNALHFELPAFTATPGKTLVGEIDGGPG